LSYFKEMQKDARYNGFQGFIKKLALAKLGNPISRLVSSLKKLTFPEEDGKIDPFRVATSIAARGLLVEVINVNIETEPKDSQAEILGKKLATLEIRDIVVRFIKRFIFGFISDIMKKADPNDVEGLIEEVIGLVEDTTVRIAKRAVEKIDKEENLCNTSRIHQIVTEELKILTERELGIEKKKRK
jgi:hypothetical protein